MKNNISIFFLFFLLWSINFPAMGQNGYDPEAAATYAQQYCEIPNPEYNNYTDLGGDCANFISQCLKAGGLELLKGIDENLPPGDPTVGGNGVDPYGCIPNIEALHSHLTHTDANGEYDYQNIIYERNTEPVHPSWMRMGDVAIFSLWNEFYNEWNRYHSVFAWAGNASEPSNPIHYAYHTSNECDRQLSYLMPSDSPENEVDFYHIIPGHCTDCVLNFDETEMDCGGSCLPCEDASNKKAYITSTSSLPAVTLAQNEITVGGVPDVYITVEPGQNVTFISGNTIHLSYDFHVKEGSIFHAKIAKTGTELNRDCQNLCDPVQRTLFYLPIEGFRWMLANAVWYEVVIFQNILGNWNQIYSNNDNIYSNGWTEFWDGQQGSNYDYYWYMLSEDENYIFSVSFIYFLTINGCLGDSKDFEGYVAFYTDYTGKSSTQHSDSTNADNIEKKSELDIQSNINNDNLSDDNTILICHPNPFDNSLQIIFSIEKDANVKLYVTNTFGITVLELFNKRVSEGLHKANISGSDLSPGIYYCILETKDYRRLIKIVKL